MSRKPMLLRTAGGGSVRAGYRNGVGSLEQVFRARRPGRASCVVVGRSREQQFAFAVVGAEVGRQRELLACLRRASEAGEEVAADAGQEVVVAQRGLVGQRVDQLEPGLGTESPRDRHGTVELDNGGAGERG